MLSWVGRRLSCVLMLVLTIELYPTIRSQSISAAFHPCAMWHCHWICPKATILEKYFGCPCAAFFQNFGAGASRVDDTLKQTTQDTVSFESVSGFKSCVQPQACTHRALAVGSKPLPGQQLHSNPLPRPGCDLLREASKRVKNLGD